MLCIVQIKMEQNKMGGKVSRNDPDNEELSSPSFIIKPWLVKKTCIKGYPGGGIQTKDPHPYPLVYLKGGGGSAPKLRTKRDRK